MPSFSKDEILDEESTFLATCESHEIFYSGLIQKRYIAISNIRVQDGYKVEDLLGNKLHLAKNKINFYSSFCYYYLSVNNISDDMMLKDLKHLKLKTGRSSGNHILLLLGGILNKNG